MFWGVLDVGLTGVVATQRLAKALTHVHSLTGMVEKKLCAKCRMR